METFWGIVVIMIVFPCFLWFAGWLAKEIAKAFERSWERSEQQEGLKEALEIESNWLDRLCNGP